MNLSPSLNHGYLMSKLNPSMAYDGGDVAAWQRRLRRKLRGLLGPFPADACALRPRRLWLKEHPLGSIEKVVFTAEQRSDVTAYVCLPRDVKPPYRFVICLQGHSTGAHNSIAVEREDETIPRLIEGDRDFGIGCMQRGLAALCIEQRAFGERREQLQNGEGCQSAAMHALMLGRTLIGERVYDVDRGIDYLAARGDADMRNLCVMGNSGGGTISLFAAAMLPRLAYAMPSCYFCTFRASVMAMQHCMCNYVPGIMQIAEMSDVMGLFAPKPVVIVAGRDDSIFPIKATRAAFRKLKAIYKEAGAEEHCHLVVGQGGHRFYADDAWPVMLREMGLKDSC